MRSNSYLLSSRRVQAAVLVKIIILLLTVAFGFCVAQEPAHGLSRYVGRDLRKLGTNEMASLREAFKARTGDELGEKWGWSPFECWSLYPCNTPESAWVLVEAYPGYGVPDISGMKLHFFDKSWTRTCKQSFPTGYRFFLDSVTVQKRPELDRPLIVAKVTSAVPFITSPGPKLPAFEKGNFQLQYYALFETNLFIVRLEDNKAVLQRNHYRWRTPSKGPPVPQRTKEAWLKSLDSSSAIEQLAALVWLTGSHLSSAEERKSDHNQESVEDAKTFEAVRNDPRTKSILGSLKRHQNKWIQEYTTLGIE
jgi:hypothetical protein